MFHNITEKIYAYFVTGKCMIGSLDLVIILDASTSVTVGNYKKVLKFVKSVLRDADIDSGKLIIE